MFKRSLLAAALTSGLLAGTAAAPLSAAAPLAMTVPSAMPLAAVGISDVACSPVAPAPTRPLAAPTSARMAKSAAILGGQMSALDRMRLEQSGAAVPAPAAPTLQPAAAAMSAANNAACATLRGPQKAAAIGAVPTVRGNATGRFLGTELLKIGRTRFDDAWDRVSARDLSRRDVRRAMGQLSGDRADLLEQVNGWVNREIRYGNDRQLYGQTDYWADARTTLRSKAGDCEDIAILKMQMLAAAGVARDDMLLTLARDTIRRSDHAVLLVKHGEGWVMLDMGSDRVAPAGLDYGYRPVLSFTAGNRYIHGTPVDRLPRARTVRVAYAN